ncbi:hypothetical protein CP02DC14_0687B, partial [Chlamydia psittaci 02DC14]
RRFYNHV